MTLSTVNPTPPHPWLRANLPKEYSQLKSRSFFLSTATKVSYLSVAIMTVSTLLLPLFINAMAARVILGVSTMIVVPFLAKVTIHFQNEHKSIKNRLESHKLTLNEFERIKDWNSLLIEEFFHAQHIPLPSNCDLHDLLPGIARYKARERQAAKEEEKADHLLNAEEMPEDLENESRDKGWRALEQIVLPLKVEAAFCLEILRNPTLNVGFDEAVWLKQKTFSSRHQGRIYKNEDSYLRMMHDKRGITFDTVQKSNIQKLNQLMFA